MNSLYEKEIDKILFTEEVLQARVSELGRRVSEDYHDKELHLVAVLKGALVFLADFSRALTVQTTMDFMVVSTYEGADSSGDVQIVKDLTHSIRGRHVLLLEDVIDHGTTLQTLLRTLSLRKPASLKICTLFDKPARRKVDLTPDYNGLVVSDEFIVGYGLDYQERYRELPFVATLRKEVYKRF